MMYEGHIIYDVSGEEKKNLHVEATQVNKFCIASGGEFANDRTVFPTEHSCTGTRVLPGRVPFCALEQTACRKPAGPSAASCGRITA